MRFQAKQIQELLGIPKHRYEYIASKIGIKPDTQNVAIVIVAKEEEQIPEVLLNITKHIGSDPDEAVIGFSNEKQKKILEIFEISKNEIESVLKDDNIIEAIKDIIIERMAILSTKI